MGQPNGAIGFLTAGRKDDLGAVETQQPHPLLRREPARIRERLRAVERRMGRGADERAARAWLDGQEAEEVVA